MDGKGSEIGGSSGRGSNGASESRMGSMVTGATREEGAGTTGEEGAGTKWG